MCGGGRFFYAFCVAQHEQEQEQEKRRAEEELYRAYITDALQIVEQNTARQGGSAHTKRYSEIVDMMRNPERYRIETAEQTIDRFINMLTGEEGNAD